MQGEEGGRHKQEESLCKGIKSSKMGLGQTLEDWTQERVGSPGEEAQRRGRSQSRGALKKDGNFILKGIKAFL